MELRKQGSDSTRKFWKSWLALQLGTRGGIWDISLQSCIALKESMGNVRPEFIGKRSDCSLSRYREAVNENPIPLNTGPLAGQVHQGLVRPAAFGAGRFIISAELFVATVRLKNPRLPLVTQTDVEDLP
jgi:hypothetical protein